MIYVCHSRPCFSTVGCPLHMTVRSQRAGSCFYVAGHSRNHLARFKYAASDNLSLIRHAFGMRSRIAPGIVTRGIDEGIPVTPASAGSMCLHPHLDGVLLSSSRTVNTATPLQWVVSCLCCSTLNALLQTAMSLRELACLTQRVCCCRHKAEVLAAAAAVGVAGAAAAYYWYAGVTCCIMQCALVLLYPSCSGMLFMHT